jgi:4-hydroxy-4-methyl-2-oxoglutarate aldolase
MKPVVVRNIKRADPAGMAEYGVATVHEAYGRIGLMKPYLRPVWAGAAIAGPAVTVLAQPGDNWMIHVAVEQCKPGDVLVVGVTADNTDGMFGELIGTSLQAHGVKGLIIDAGCRDVKALHDMGFPVWSRAVSDVASSSPNMPSVLSVVQPTTRTSPFWHCSTATWIIQLSPGCASTVTALPAIAAPG